MECLERKRTVQLSKFTDYSFRALIYLAQNRDKLCTVEELARNLQASEHHMKKIIHKLATTDYVESVKGRAGGLYLGMDPEEINLGDILQLTEDNLNIFPCFHTEETCPFMTTECKLRAISKTALKNFMDEFSKHTLRDVL